MEWNPKPSAGARKRSAINFLNCKLLTLGDQQDLMIRRKLILTNCDEHILLYIVCTTFSSLHVYIIWYCHTVVFPFTLGNYTVSCSLVEYTLSTTLKHCMGPSFQNRIETLNFPIITTNPQIQFYPKYKIRYKSLKLYTETQITV